MKNRGITIAILYIPYQPIANPSTDFAITKTATPTITSRTFPAPFRVAPRPTFFYTASTPTDIQNALLAMFEQAVSTPTSHNRLAAEPLYGLLGPASLSITGKLA